MIALPHSLLESQTDIFEPATVCAPGAPVRPVKRHFGRNIQNQGEIRLKTATDKFIQKAHGMLAQAAAKPLVGEARVIKAITDHQFAPRKCRAQHFLQVLVPGGIHEQQFRHGRQFPIGRSEQKIADLFADAGTPGFTRDAGSVTAPAQPAYKQPQLSALASAVNSLQGDENSTLLQKECPFSLLDRSSAFQFSGERGAATRNNETSGERETWMVQYAIKLTE